MEVLSRDEFVFRRKSSVYASNIDKIHIVPRNYLQTHIIERYAYIPYMPYYDKFSGFCLLCTVMMK